MSPQQVLRALERDLGRPIEQWTSEDWSWAAVLTSIVFLQQRQLQLLARVKAELGKRLLGQPRARRPRLLSLDQKRRGGQATTGFTLYHAEPLARALLEIIVCRDEPEALKAAYWMRWFAREYIDWKQKMKLSDRGRHAAKYPRPGRLKVTDAEISAAMERAKRRNVPKRNLVGALQRLLGSRITDEALRKRLTTLYPKIFPT